MRISPAVAKVVDNWAEGLPSSTLEVTLPMVKVPIQPSPGHHQAGLLMLPENETRTMSPRLP